MLNSQMGLLLGQALLDLVLDERSRQGTKFDKFGSFVFKTYTRISVKFSQVIGLNEGKCPFLMHRDVILF